MQIKLAAQVKLASRAQRLSRLVYASLPFHYRFGVVLEVLSSSYAQLKDGLGRAFYAEFLKAGIEMPDINGQPAEEYLEKVKRRGADALPRGYGGRFSRAVAGLVRSKLPSEADSEDFLQDLQVMLLKGHLKLDKSKAADLKAAESFAMKFVDWRIQDWLRSPRKRNQSGQQSLTDVETGGQHDIEDMSGADLQQVFDRMRPGDGKKLVQELRRIDPKFPNRAEQWLVSKMEGWSGRELADEWGMTEGRVSQWTSKFLPKIQDIFEKYFWAVAV